MGGTDEGIGDRLVDRHRHRLGGRIAVAQPTNDLRIGLDRDPLGDQLYLDHIDQRLELGILRG